MRQAAEIMAGTKAKADAAPSSKWKWVPVLLVAAFYTLDDQLKWNMTAIMIWPAISGGIFFIAANRWMPAEKKRYLDAIGIQFAQLAWMIIGISYYAIAVGSLSPQHMQALGFDAVILLAGILWLYLRPSLWPVLLLTTYQSFCLAIIGLEVFSPEDAAPTPVQLKVLAIKALLNVLAIGYMSHSYFYKKANEEL